MLSRPRHILQRIRWQNLTGRAPGTCQNCSQFVETVAGYALRPPEGTLYPRVFMGRRPFSLGLAALRRAPRFL